MQELWFLYSASRLMLIDIYMKTHEDRMNGFEVTEWTRFCDKVQEKLLKSINARVMVLDSECRLMLIDIYMRFCEDSLNCFRVIAQIPFCGSPREVSQKV